MKKLLIAAIVVLAINAALTAWLVSLALNIQGVAIPIETAVEVPISPFDGRFD